MASDHLRPGAGEVRAVITFDEARAACVERWGEPVSRDQRRGHTTVAWVGGHRRGGWPDSCWLECVDGRVMLLAHSGTEERLWLLAGTYPDAPILTVTPLPDALDAAVRWMAERAP